jgi:lipoic acid synthetase
MIYGNFYLYKGNLEVIMDSTQRKPKWLKAQIPGGQGYTAMSRLMREHKLHTVCEEAKCPNLGECWSKGAATVMILGDTCTRACGFCNVKTGRPKFYDREEPARVAESVKLMQLKYVTITSVNRDELEDQGSLVWAETIQAIRAYCPGIKIEVLTPDFRGNTSILDAVLDSNPDVYNHNLEVVYRLQKAVRRMANWQDSHTMLAHAKSRGFVTKTGLMVGMGETDAEVYDFIDKVSELKVDILSIGQYLQPTKKHLPVLRYVDPVDFKEYAAYALKKGIPKCQAGPLVRSSYHADEQSSGVV